MLTGIGVSDRRETMLTGSPSRSGDDSSVVPSTPQSEAIGGARGMIMAILKKVPTTKALLSRYRPVDLNYTRVAVQLNEQVGLHDNAARPLAFSVQLVGHFFAGVVLFGAFEWTLRHRARRAHRAEVNTDMALRANGAETGMSLWDLGVAGAVGGAAHAVATSPIVAWQRSGAVIPARPSAWNFALVVARDSASFSSFFATFAWVFKPRDDVYDGLRAAAAGGTAGLVCHAVRFPLQTLYKRGRGWVDPQTLCASTLARRFVTTSGRAILSASLAFGAYEVIASVLKKDETKNRG